MDSINWVNEFQDCISIFDNDEKQIMYEELIELVEKLKNKEPRAAHTLKGCVSQLSITPLYESAKNIDNNININENMDIILKIMNEIKAKNLFQID